MKEYCSIDAFNKGKFGEKCFVFYKEDGSNLRFTYNRKKKGWTKSGTRNCIIDKTHPDFGNGVDIFMEKFSEPLQQIFKDSKDYRNVDELTVFGEYFGENSFAGWHDPNDTKDILLFDVWQYKKGFVQPSQFVKDFEHLGITRLLGVMDYDKELIKAVQNNTLEEVFLKEGVVCKGNLNRKGQDNVWMSKIKTIEWLKKIKKNLGEKALFDESGGDLDLISKIC